jgi:hypothetical protein
VSATAPTPSSPKRKAKVSDPSPVAAAWMRSSTIPVPQIHAHDGLSFGSGEVRNSQMPSQSVQLHVVELAFVSSIDVVEVPVVEALVVEVVPAPVVASVVVEVPVVEVVVECVVEVMVEVPEPAVSGSVLLVLSGPEGTHALSVKRPTAMQRRGKLTMRLYGPT